MTIPTGRLGRADVAAVLALVASLVAVPFIAAACGAPSVTRQRPSVPVDSTPAVATSGAIPSSSSSSSPSPSSSSSAPAGPAVVTWGSTDGLLSVVVQNQSALEITSAHVLITALDANGDPIASTSGAAGSKCCTILGLPPGRRFGLFADLGALTQRVRDVQVRYLGVQVQEWDPSGAGSVLVSDPVLSTDGDGDAVVTATLSATGPVGPYVVGQAFLAGPSGELVGVISGRFYCFGDGVSAARRMQFLHPVPPDTRVAAVAAYPVPLGQPAGVPDSCPG